MVFIVTFGTFHISRYSGCHDNVLDPPVSKFKQEDSEEIIVTSVFLSPLLGCCRSNKCSLRGPRGDIIEIVSPSEARDIIADIARAKRV